MKGGVLSKMPKSIILNGKNENSLGVSRMCRDQRGAFLLWAAVLAAGAALSRFVSQGFAIAAFAVWLVLFFRDVHFDAEKAFAKYRR